MSEPAFHIRPLVWRRGPPPLRDSDLYKWHADTVIGFISISAGLYHLKETATRHVSGVGDYDVEHKDDAAAKVAAEKWYREELLKALKPVKL